MGNNTGLYMCRYHKFKKKLIRNARPNAPATDAQIRVRDMLSKSNAIFIARQRKPITEYFTAGLSRLGRLSAQ